MLSFLTLAGTTTAAAQEFGTILEARRMAEDAAELILDVGFLKALPDLLDPNGPFRDRDLYVFVLDLHGNVAAHPNLPAIGSSALNSQDASGRFYIRDMLARVERGESGFWIEYQWPHPILGRMMNKVTWIVRAGNVVVGCGAYPEEAS